MNAEPNAADHRRATAFCTHFGRGSLEGGLVIVEEAIEADRIGSLIKAVITLHSGIVPVLLTEDGIACASVMVHTLAEDENISPEIREAARLVIADSLGDDGALNTIAACVITEEREAELLLAVLRVYRHACPQLYSPLGLNVLQRSVTTWAEREEEERDA